ncbi:MAG: hypothetical protein ABSC53_09500 [Bacteroidota bacterium]
MQTRLKINLSHGIFLAIVILLSFINFSCATSRLTNVWKSPEYKNPPMTNMLIIAAKNNSVNRHLWEDVIVAELSVRGVKSTPSYRLFADSIPNPEQVRAAVQEKKFDGVLFIRRLPTELSTNYKPGNVSGELVTRYNERTSTYSTFYEDVQQLGSTDTTKVVRQEVKVFTTQESYWLVWSGVGEMINPNSSEEIRDVITGLVIPELARQGIIPAK